MKINESLKLISDTFWQVKDKKDFKNVLEDLLTPSEVCEIADRIKILKNLKNDISQREIAKKLWVSITTVSRWNRILRYQRKAIHKYI